MSSQAQREDASKISQRIRQFRVLYEYWKDEAMNVDCDMTLFQISHIAWEIVAMIREHVREYNLHSGITVDLLERLQ